MLNAHPVVKSLTSSVEQEHDEYCGERGRERWKEEEGCGIERAGTHLSIDSYPLIRIWNNWDLVACKQLPVQEGFSGQG